MALSNFNIRAVFHYLAERFQVGRFVPLALILYLGYLLCIDFLSVRPQDFFILLLLILSFRLMDDLFDLRFDRIVHPIRVLSKEKDIKIFIIFLVILYLMLSIFFIWEKKFISFYLILVAILFFSFWYAKLRYFFNSKLLHALVILTKYPFFLYILEPVLPISGIPILIYLTFLLFEIQDDPELKVDITAKRIQTAGSFVYLTYLFFLLNLPSKSIGSWSVLLLSLYLQVAILAQKDARTPYIPFLNTLLIFVFLSARFFLK
jgi:hypothetical protein